MKATRKKKRKRTLYTLTLCWRFNISSTQLNIRGFFLHVFYAIPELSRLRQ